ncbi:alpha/beta hydrolase [Nocardia sp. NBC_00565]|nr:alpha/beta hydrolase [Nocardia sp. NBC_00565]
MQWLIVEGGDDIGTDRVSPVSAPARLTDFAGLAPAFIDVGELDIFRDECLQYARHLGLAGVSTELHIRSGDSHDFDVLGVGDLSARSHADRHRIIKSLYAWRAANHSWWRSSRRGRRQPQLPSEEARGAPVVPLDLVS